MTAIKNRIWAILFIVALGSFVGASSSNFEDGSNNSTDAVKESYEINASLTTEELVNLVDTFFSLDTLNLQLLKQFEALAEKKINPEDTNPHPAHHIYKSWVLGKINPYTAKDWKNDTSFALQLIDKEENCLYEMPIRGVITSNFGMRDGKMHKGMDIDLVTGDSVVSAFSGKVRVARRHSGYGKVVIIRHHNGFETTYAHLSKLKVKEGDVVDPGQLIGLGGNTGHSSGSHLHFEVRFKGVPINPKHVINFKKENLISDSVIVKRTRWGYTAYPSGTEFHTIVKGDYMYRIANKYGISVRQICEWNGMKKSSVLVVGRKLKVSQ